MVRITETLYEETRQARLGTEKFMMDGPPRGHWRRQPYCPGRGDSSDSPLLRRPDLLRSLVCYWQNHPSLSFLFSSQFIGPTSQHPRVDEARNDSLHELEIAFQELDRQLAKCGGTAWAAWNRDAHGAGEGMSAQGAEPAAGVSFAGSVPPWLVDRLFRNLLIDATGNTHRSEFCINKLYSPDSSTGRLGLLELWAFEMPPHARMSLTQNLLLRSLVARFWKEPYQRALVRWGTELHDRFLLPHFVQQDFEDVIEDLNQLGYPLKKEWFAPHHEFRFPKYGEVTYRG